MTRELDWAAATRLAIAYGQSWCRRRYATRHALIAGVCKGVTLLVIAGTSILWLRVDGGTPLNITLTASISAGLLTILRHFHFIVCPPDLQFVATHVSGSTFLMSRLITAAVVGAGTALPLVTPLLIYQLVVDGVISLIVWGIAGLVAGGGVAVLSFGLFAAIRHQVFRFGNRREVPIFAAIVVLMVAGPWRLLPDTFVLNGMISINAIVTILVGCVVAAGAAAAGPHFLSDTALSLEHSGRRSGATRRRRWNSDSVWAARLIIDAHIAREPSFFILVLPVAFMIGPYVAFQLWPSISARSQSDEVDLLLGAILSVGPVLTPAALKNAFGRSRSYRASWLVQANALDLDRLAHSTNLIIMGRYTVVMACVAAVAAFLGLDVQRAMASVPFLIVGSYICMVASGTAGHLPATRPLASPPTARFFGGTVLSAYIVSALAAAVAITCRTLSSYLIACLCSLVLAWLSMTTVRADKWLAQK